LRVVLDTNVLLAALLTRGTTPDKLYEAWREGRFQLASCERQLEEINRVSRRPFFRERLAAGAVGRMVNDIRALALMCDPLPKVAASPDPEDDFLLATAQSAGAEFLVTGDKSGLLALKKHGATAILTAKALLDRLD
jgi:putative PIN family toxin of toxin-antitoxin system